jgi:flagellar biosynthetic protein FliQ
MSDAEVLTLLQRALETLMWIAGPMLAVAILVGVVVSLIQTLTSIQDQTFSFAPRVVAMLVVFLISLPWAIRILVTFTTDLFKDFTPYLK